MRIGIVVVLMTALSFTSFAQKSGQKAIEKDSVAFFYAAIELSNGINVLTSIDSISTAPKDMAKSLFQVDAANRLRILRLAQVKMADKSLTMKNDKIVVVLNSKGSLKEIKTEMDRFVNVNKGAIYNLDDFKFIKPAESEQEGPQSKVTVH